MRDAWHPHTVVISCDCPDFVSHLRQQTQSSAATAWCKHATALVWFVASDYRIIYELAVNNPIPRQLQIGDTNAGGAAPAAAVSVPNREGAAGGSAMSTEVALQGLTIFPRPQTDDPPRPQTREDIVHELAVVVEQRDRCRTLTGRNTADSDFMQNLYDYMREYGPEPLLYMPGEGILLRRVDVSESRLVRSALIRFTAAWGTGETNVSMYFTFDKAELTNDYLQSAQQGGQFVIYLDREYAIGSKSYPSMRNEVARLIGVDNIRLYTVQGDSHEELVQRYRNAGRDVARGDAVGHLHAKTMRLGPYNLDTSANGTTSTECNHERGGLCHLTEVGHERALALEARVMQSSEPLTSLGSWNPVRPPVAAAGAIYEPSAVRRG